jgi:hypothetical protein
LGRGRALSDIVRALSCDRSVSAAFGKQIARKRADCWRIGNTDDLPALFLLPDQPGMGKGLEVEGQCRTCNGAARAQGADGQPFRPGADKRLQHRKARLGAERRECQRRLFTTGILANRFHITSIVELNRSGKHPLRGGEKGCRCWRGRMCRHVALSRAWVANACSKGCNGGRRFVPDLGARAYADAVVGKAALA